MYITITSITLRSPWKFFALSRYALDISRQLKKTPVREFKKRGVGLTHYTMTLWNNAEDLKEFAKSGAHAMAMRKTNKLAHEVRTLTLPQEVLPSWAEAKQMLEERGKVLTFA